MLTAKDRIQVSFDREGIRNVTIAFLSNPNSSFPYWQGYLQGCCFDRDIYKNAEKSGLYDKVKASLSAQNLYRVPNSFILHGPSNSGKSVLLGKLALELSSEYPVLYIKGELETNDPEFSRYQYDTLVSFINEHLTRSSESDKKLRAVVIWDNNAFIDKINNYKELERELAKSNSILVGSAYELREETDVTSMFRRGVEYIEVSPLLNPDTELKSMKSMLDKNLGVGFNQAFNKAKAAHQNKSKKPNLIRDENRILSLLQRTFRVASDEYREIVEQAENRANLEASGNDELMQEQFRTAIEWASDDFDTDIKGILEILHSFDDCEKVNVWLSDTLDKNDIIERSYNLEVSSAGLDRELLKDSDYVRFAGRAVEVKTYEQINGSKSHEGILAGKENGIVTIDTGAGELAIPADKIAKINLAVVF